MKTISTIIIPILALLAASCSNKSATTEANEATSALTVDQLLMNPASLVDSIVEIEGVCTHTCKHGATKMFLIGTDDTKTIRVEACKLGAFRPDVINSLVKVKGYLRQQRIDENYLAAWEQRINDSRAEKHGETGSGCDSERAARGVESVSATDQIAEYRRRIAEKVANGEEPWLSYYHIDAIEYEIDN